MTCNSVNGLAERSTDNRNPRWSEHRNGRGSRSRELLHIWNEREGGGGVGEEGVFPSLLISIFHSVQFTLNAILRGHFRFC